LGPKPNYVNVKQVRGVAMGSPLSPVICNLFLEELESRDINSFDPTPTVFLRYVDDIFFLWSESTRPIEEFHQHLNNQNASITFAVEKEVEGVIPFVDVLVKRRNQKIETEVYSRFRTLPSI
jgi:hypothetical protein